MAVERYAWLEWAEREGGIWYHPGTLDIDEVWETFVSGYWQEFTWRYLQQAAQTIDRDIMGEVAE